MRRILAFITAIAALCGIVAGCADRPTNGHLDGQWQLMTVERPDSPVLIVDQSYYCFYRHTAMLRRYDAATSRTTEVAANLVYDSDTDSLTLHCPYGGSWLGHWGIGHSTPYTFGFKVIHLSRKSLVMLYRDSAVFTLRKF